MDIKYKIALAISILKQGRIIDAYAELKCLLDDIEKEAEIKNQSKLIKKHYNQ